jgi:hypothetical protein
MEFLGKELPPEVVDALLHRITLQDDKSTLICASEYKIKAIRLIPKNAPGIRDVFTKKVRSASKISGDLQKFIETVILNTSCFGVISTQAITMFAHDWMGYFSEADALGCWLFDMRDDIRQFAMRQLACFPHKKVPDKETALKNLRNTFAGFLSQIQPLVEDHEPAEKITEEHPPIPKDAIWGEALAELRERARKTAKLQKLIDSERIKADTVKADLDQAHSKIAELEKIVKNLASQNHDLSDTLEHERAWQANQIKAGVTREITARENRWLAELEATKSANKPAAQGSALLETAQTLLERQYQIDSIYGNQRQLEDKLTKVQQMRLKIQTARLEALNPINELNEIEEQLEKEENTIIDQLGSRSTVRVPRQFLDEIEAASSLDELNSCRTRLQEAANAGFIDSNIQNTFEKLLHRREAVIYLKALTPRVVSAAPLKGLARLISELKNGEPLKVWIDGHNVINSLELFKAISRAGKDHQHVRNELIKRMIPLAKQSSAAHWVLVFDAPYASNQMTSARNLIVRYSGGGNRSQKADNLISGEISCEFSESSALSRYVFTNDNTLAEEISQLGATALTCDDLQALL